MRDTLRKKLWTGWVLAAALSTAELASAQILIDDFEQGGGSGGVGATGCVGNGGEGSGTLGGRRGGFTCGVSGYGQVILSEFDAVWSYSAPGTISALVQLTWDGDVALELDPAGLGSIDLTDGGALDGIEVTTRYSDVPLTMTFVLYSDAGVHSSSGVLSQPGLQLDPTVIGIPFSEFEGDANLTTVSAVELLIDAPLGADFELDRIEVTSGVGASPVAGVQPPAFQPRDDGFRDNGILVDGFEVGPHSAVLLPGDSLSRVATDGQTGFRRTILGGERNEWTANTGAEGRIDERVSLSAFFYSADIRAEGRVAFSWDGADGDASTLDPAGLGSIDLTRQGSLDAFLVKVNFSDVPSTLSFSVYSDAGLAASVAELAVPELLFIDLPAFEFPKLYLPFADFVGTADFEDVSAVEVVVNGVRGWDLEIDHIAAVPEPARALQAIAELTALIAIARVRRRG